MTVKNSNKNNQKPCVIWMTGLSGAGKTTIAKLMQDKLIEQGTNAFILDGDNLRFGLNKDLGFSLEDRTENNRRVAEVANLMADSGLTVIVSLISPLAKDRQMARDIIGSDRFIEAYVNTSLEVAEKRDVKGLYKKARNGEIDNFTGISSPYDVPKSPDIILDTVNKSPDELAQQLFQYAEDKKKIIEMYYVEVDHNVYQIEKYKNKTKALIVLDDGNLQEVPSARIIPNGIRLSEKEFLEEKEEILKEHQARVHQSSKHNKRRP